MSEEPIIELEKEKEKETQSESEPKSQSDAFLNQATLDYLINTKQYKNNFYKHYRFLTLYLEAYKE